MVAAARWIRCREEALAGGIVENDGNGVRAAVHLHPYEDWWVVADLPRYLRPGPPRVDLSPRAVRFAATTAALNGLDWEVLRGDLVEPVAGRRFDLVLC